MYIMYMYTVQIIIINATWKISFRKPILGWKIYLRFNMLNI